MTFSVECDEGTKGLGIDIRAVFEKAASAALEYTGCPYECDISLTLTGDEVIRQMNREHRNTDRATDVLSFPMLEFEEPGDYSAIEEGTPDAFDPDTGELLLGDIVISADHVLSQAEEYGHTVLREYAFLIVHSMLHLQGFDHIEPDDALIMERAQDDIMEKIGIRR